ncbi:MAG: creatininase family protein [Gemmatimonadota bacterium]|nr:creatininase family protein [Gemmatimonadota bacterium]
MKSHKFADHTYLEIRDLVDAGCAAIVPTGCTEQQGPHLPVDFDTWFAETVAIEAAQHAACAYGVKAIVLPAMPFGPTPEHRGFGSGYVNIPHPLHDDFAYHIMKSLAEQGFRAIVVWRGCGEHRLQEAVDRFNAKFNPGRMACLPSLPYNEIWRQVADPCVPGGHADSFTTSIALYKRPGTVRLESIPSSRSREVDWDDPDLDFTKYSDNGVIGDASKASAELGRRLWQEVISTAAEVFRDALASCVTD